MEKEKTNIHSALRTLYLYAFALIGLVMVVIGTVNLVDMALKATIFTAADQEELYYSKQPPYISTELMDKANTTEPITLTQEQANELSRITQEYQTWQSDGKNLNPVVSRRQREASTSIAQIVIGLPLYLYHWLVIRRELRKKA